MTGGAILRIALSFAITGSVIGLVTFVGERLGSVVGGLVGNLPSNILISMIFISLINGPEYAAEACRSVPIGMAINTLFLVAFVVCIPKGFKYAISISLSTWVFAALLAMALPPIRPLWSLVLYSLITITCFLFLQWLLKVKSATKKRVEFSLAMLATRSLFAGTIVAAAVAAAVIAPPYLTGIIATFPAVLLSTMVLITRSQGAAFAQSTGKVLVVSTANIVLYGLGVGALFPCIGPWWGSAVALSASILFISFLFPIIRMASRPRPDLQRLHIRAKTP